MSNPRKFSEKIAIQNQKAMEGNQAFDDIMREVNETKMREVGMEFLRMKYRGGSLPNFNSELQNAPDSLPDMSPTRGFNDLRTRRNLVSRPVHAHKARMESSPYAYQRLMPNQEPENSWRRVRSDSSIHQTLTQNPNQPQRDMRTGPPPNAKPMVSSPPQLPKSPENTFMPGIPARRLSDRSSAHHMQIQANTGSLPDLSSLHIPSPLQKPLDLEDNLGGFGKGMQSPAPQGPFHVPLRVAPRQRPSVSCGKQYFMKQLSSPEGDNDKKMPPVFVDGKDGPDLGSMLQPGGPPPGAMSPTMQGNFYWNTPISPLANEAFLHQIQQHTSPVVSNPYTQTDLHQQLQQIQMKDAGMYDHLTMSQPPPPYTATMEQANQQMNLERTFGRASNGVPEIILSDSLGPKDDFSREFGNAMGVIGGYQGQKSELTDDALNSVRVGLDPLNFEDVQILSGENPDVVDQSTEEQFRLERVGFQ